MKNFISLLFSAVLANVLALAAFGQTSGTLTAIPEPGIKNKPYSAESTRENVKILPDGNKITQIYKYIEYRDSKGRTRNEQISQSDPQPFSSTSIRIYDPVARYSYSLNPTAKTVYRTPLPPPGTTFRPMAAPSANTFQKEQLGTRVIEGFETTGFRYINTIAAGTVGNEKELKVVSESWFYPELLLNILYTTDDPRYGATTTSLTNIKRDEPDKSLFEIPADYKIIDREPFRPIITAPNPASNNSNEKKP